MGVGNQFACVSLVAAFSIVLLLTANIFVESRTSKDLATPVAQHVRIHL
jgi:hypothetical protein